MKNLILAVTLLTSVVSVNAQNQEFVCPQWDENGEKRSS